MRIAFAMGLAVLLGATTSVQAQSIGSPPSAAKLRYWAGGDCINAGKYVGFDYARALERAIHKEPSGLAELFRFTDTAGFDGAAGEGHVQILFGLLQRWGDRRFARVLRAQSSHIREIIVFEFGSAFPDQRSQFPKTYSLAPH